MSRRPRRNHTPGFRAKVALASIKGDRTLAQLAEQFDVHPNQITSWKAQLEEGAADVVRSQRRGDLQIEALQLLSPAQLQAVRSRWWHRTYSPQIVPRLPITIFASTTSKCSGYLTP